MVVRLWWLPRFVVAGLALILASAASAEDNIRFTTDAISNEFAHLVGGGARPI